MTDGRRSGMETLKRKVRKTFDAARTWLLWNQQGRPRNGPVVIREGKLTRHADGKTGIYCWHIDGRYQSKTLPVEGMWEFLSARYPVEGEEV